MGLKRYTVSVENFQGYTALWHQYRHAWQWPCIFTLPFWLETVCRHLGAPGEPHIAVVCDVHEPIGVVPLALDGSTAAFLGDKEVCDYQDLIAAPGMDTQVLETVVGHLGAHGIRDLDLRTIRPDAAVLCALRQLAPGRSTVAFEQVDVTHETDLPQAWEAFLLQLNAKQRHEVRRKVRRLEKEADFRYRRFDNAGAPERAADAFVALFRGSREDKAAFMSGGMIGYFNDLIAMLARHDLLRLYFLEVGGQPAATVLCFDHNGVRYLYNSGYDDKYDHLSVGILSKIFSIQSGIEMGCRRYDFLRGAEIYHPVGGFEALATAPVLVISEGYATSASLAEVLGHATISAFDSGNLVPVAKDLHDKYPDKPIIIAGDNDREVEIKQGINPGRVKAEEAATAVGGKATFPIFAPGEQDANPAAYSDFNDLATKSLLGKNGIERQVKAEIGRMTIKTDQPLKQKKLKRQQTEREMRRAKTIKMS